MKNNYPKKILISGGWGYANLGDDAILLATLKLVKNFYPHSEIVVMTYDSKDTLKNHLGHNIKVVHSVHRHFSGRLSKLKLKIPNDKRSIKSSEIRPFDTLRSRIEQSIVYRAYRFLSKKFERLLEDPTKLEVYGEFKSSDLFIQAGGGYFIEGWEDSFYSRILELSISNQLNLKTLVIGQSIGPFQSEKSKSLVSRALKSATLVSVRDTESQKELRSLGVETVLVPDTVLSDTEFNYEKNNTIAVILGSSRLNSAQVNEIKNAIATVAKESAYKFRILVSRQWVPDIQNAYSIYDELSIDGVSVSICIPDSYKELQDELGACNIVISQNLHGLIMGWRVGCPSVSLNSKRKFVSFMEQSKQSGRLIPMDRLSSDLLVKCIKDSIEASKRDDGLRHQIALEVTEKFNECLAAVYNA